VLVEAPPLPAVLADSGPAGDSPHFPINDMSVFTGCVPLPMQLPAPAFGQSRIPWFYMDG